MKTIEATRYKEAVTYEVDHEKFEVDHEKLVQYRIDIFNIFNQFSVYQFLPLYYKQEDALKAYNKLINTQSNKKFRLVEIYSVFNIIKYSNE